MAAADRWRGMNSWNTFSRTCHRPSSAGSRWPSARPKHTTCKCSHSGICSACGHGLVDSSCRLTGFNCLETSKNRKKNCLTKTIVVKIGQNDLFPKRKTDSNQICQILSVFSGLGNTTLPRWPVRPTSIGRYDLRRFYDNIIRALTKQFGRSWRDQSFFAITSWNRMLDSEELMPFCRFFLLVDVRLTLGYQGRIKSHRKKRPWSYFLSFDLQAQLQSAHWRRCSTKYNWFYFATAVRRLRQW